MSRVLGRESVIASGIASAKLDFTPVKFWAVVGAFFIALQGYAFTRWIRSDLFAPTPTGDTPVPPETMFWINFWQYSLAILSVIYSTWIIRKCFKEKRITLDALVIVACGSCFWQDGLTGFFSMAITYNSHLVNFGTWYPFIPGWLSPNSQGISEPILFALVGCYMGVWAMFVVAGAAAMRMIKQRWPDTRFITLLLAAMVIGFIFDFIIEFTWIRQGVYAFPHTVSALALWAGTPNQFPLLEAIFGFSMGGTVFLYFYRDDKGLMLTERGLDKIRSPSGRTLVRFLALSGFYNLFMLITYTAPTTFLALYADETVPNTPSYFLNGMCGKGTAYECPAPDVPLAMPHARPIAPYTGRN